MSHDFYVTKKVGRFRRWWHLILTGVFNQEVCVYAKVQGSRMGYDDLLHPHFLCASCYEYVDWQYGAADAMPQVCDDCWQDAMMVWAVAKMGNGNDKKTNEGFGEKVSSGKVLYNGSRDA